MGWEGGGIHCFRVRFVKRGHTLIQGRLGKGSLGGRGYWLGEGRASRCQLGRRGAPI